MGIKCYDCVDTFENREHAPNAKKEYTEMVRRIRKAKGKYDKDKYVMCKTTRRVCNSCFIKHIIHKERIEA